MTTEYEIIIYLVYIITYDPGIYPAIVQVQIQNTV